MIDNCLIFIPSKRISPELTSAKREIKSNSVDFPAPDSPTKATTCPFFIVRFISFNTFSELFCFIKALPRREREPRSQRYPLQLLCSRSGYAR